MQFMLWRGKKYIEAAKLIERGNLYDPAEAVTLNYLSTFGCWCLKDGDEEKESTNGTWLYALNEYPLFDGMMIAVKNEQLEFTVNA